MKMEAPSKLTKRYSVIILSGFAFLIQITNCKNFNTKDGIGYGKSFFNDNCSACHGKNDGFDDAPSLLTLNNYDSITLLKKLNSIKQDSVHRNYFKSIKYSNKEINSIAQYIKDYFIPHY